MLNAFLGVLNRLEDAIGTHFWGLPSKEFGPALLWATALSFLVKREPSFLSWSWAGWVHTTTVSDRLAIHDDIYMHHKFDSWYHHSSILTCYKVGDDGEIQCFEKNNIDRVISMRSRVIQEHKLSSSSIISIEEAIDKHFTPPSNNERILNSYISARDLSGSPLSHYVFFWTSCGTLYIDRQPKTHRGVVPRIGKFAIHSQPDDIEPVGFVRLDFEWREKQPDMLEFAVTAIGFDGLHIGERYPHIRVKLGLILITACSDSTPKVYTRVAAVEGKISQGEWVYSARSEQRLVALV
jgi:hypothetical protein